MQFTAVLLMALAALATVDDQTKCQLKADKTASGIRRAIDRFCNDSRHFNLSLQAGSNGVIGVGANDKTKACVDMNGWCGGKLLPPYPRDNYVANFYGVCAAGGKKGRPTKRFGEWGGVHFELSDA